MTRFFFLAVVYFCFSFQLLAQQQKGEFMPSPKYPELFKATIPISAKDPEWVHKMYASEPNYFEIEEAYLAYYANHPFVKTLHTQNFKHLTKQINHGDYVQEDGSILILPKRFSAATFPYKSGNLNDWQPIGPFDTYDNGGVVKKSNQANIYTLDQGVSNDSVLICGTETAGVYKSIDKGNTWFPIGDYYFVEGVSVVKIDPTNANIIYVGTSSSLHKSTDGGLTWSVVLTLNGLNANEIVIQASNNQVVHVASAKGLHRSTDGCATWTQLFSDNCWDIKYATNNSNTLFMVKKNTTKNISEFFKSTDNGLTWSNKIVGWYTPTGGTALNDGGTRIGVTNADANIIYCVVLGNDDSYDEDNNYIGIFKSTNGGENWSMPYDGDNNGSPDNEQGGPYSATHWCFSGFGNTSLGYDQGFYNLAIDVSDTDPNKFLVGMLNLYKSENGGVTYTNWGGYSCNNCTPGYRHPDHQDILINGNDVWVASDGGIDKYDVDLNRLQAMNNGITGSDYWGFGQGWNEDVVVGGRYHNGNAVYHKNYQSGKFISLGGGEAATGYVNQGENNLVYHSDISGKKIPFTFPGTTTSVAGYAMYPTETYYFAERSEVVNDPRYYNHLYLGKENKLWKSTDGGATFELLKAFDTTTTNTVRSIEISRQNPELIYVTQKVGSGCKLWKTTDAGITWSDMSLPATHSNANISLNESNVLFLILGHGSNSTTKIYKSVDGAQTWTNLTTAALNSQSLKGVMVQEGTKNGVYIHSNKKIWYKNDDMADWELFINNLPANISFCKLLPFYKDGKIRIAGSRGIWESNLFENSVSKAQPMVSQKTVNCHRTALQFEDYSVLNHAGASWLWDFPGATTVSSTTARNPKVTYALPGWYNVTLTVTDSTGLSSTKTVNNMIEVLPSICGLDTLPRLAISTSGTSASMIAPNLTHGNQDNITITGWFKPKGIQAGYSGLVSLNSASSDKFVLNVRTNNEVGYHFKSTSYWSEATNLFLPADEWSFVAIRLTPTAVTIFVNDKSWTKNHTFSAVDINQIVLGKYMDWNDRTFLGEMEEISIWKKALTDDEILLGRHLIKSNVNDTNLLAYYQLNTLTNGKTYDVIGASDASISGAASFVTSSAPVGPGISQLKTIAAAGNYDFSLVNAKMKFSGTGPNGKIVVSRLNLKPVNDTLTNKIADEYWILNNYGANATFSGMDSLIIKPRGNIVANAASNIILFKRNSNGFKTNEWTLNGNSTAISPANEAVFSGNNLNTSNQYFLGKLAPTLVVIPEAKICSYEVFDLTADSVTNGSDTNLSFTYWMDEAATTGVGAPTAASAGTYYIKGLNPVTGNSAIKPITVTAIMVDAPTGVSPQTFNNSTPGEATVADLVVSGLNITWYTNLTDAQNNTNAIPLNTILENGFSYFAVQTQNNCRSEAFEVVAVVNTVGITDVIGGPGLVQIYPNPTSDMLSVETNKIISSGGLYTLSGQLVFNTVPNQTCLELNLTDLADGLYLLKLTVEGVERSYAIRKE